MSKPLEGEALTSALARLNAKFGGADKKNG